MRPAVGTFEAYAPMVDYPQTVEPPRRWDWFPIFVFGAILAMELGLVVAMTLGS